MRMLRFLKHRPTYHFLFQLSTLCSMTCKPALTTFSLYYILTLSLSFSRPCSLPLLWLTLSHSFDSLAHSLTHSRRIGFWRFYLRTIYSTSNVLFWKYFILLESIKFIHFHPRDSLSLLSLSLFLSVSFALSHPHVFSHPVPLSPLSIGTLYPISRLTFTLFL